MKKHLLFAFIVSIVVFGTTNLFSQNGSCCDYSATSQHPGVDSETFGVALGDINNDGNVDAVVVDAYDDMEVYLNDGTGSFTYDQTYGSSNAWYGVYLVDVDSDEFLDIIVSAFYSGDGCEVWKNDGTGNFSLLQGSIATSIGMQELAIGDINGDGSPDIFAPAYSGGNSEIWFNDGSGNFTSSTQSLAGSSCTDAVLADFDGDNDLDIFVSKTNGAANVVWLNNGVGLFVGNGQSLGSSSSNGVDAADVDDDGDIDVIVANWQTPSQVWLNDGSGTFTQGFQIANNNYAKAIVLSDIDYDCDYDAIIGSYGSHGVQVWTNNGSGEYSLCYENPTDLYAHDIAVADLNNDLMPDIWAGNFSSSNGDYIFLKATPEFVNDTINVCPGDSAFVGCSWRTGEGDYLEAINCDTLAWYHVHDIIIDISISQIGDTLFAVLGYDAYQWFMCETMEPIVGANNNYYVTDTSGYFAVEIISEGCSDTSFCNWVQIPTAYFEGTPTSGVVPLMVTFTDLSVDSVNSWQWDFGDGNSSNDQNPVNEYINPGDYTVSLIVMGPGGSDTLVKSNYIDANYAPPTADFIGSPISGNAPLEVVFTDLSVDSVNYWLWNFGDGETSNNQNPTHTYGNMGTYTVSLSVGGPGGSDEMIKTDYIIVSVDPPVAEFEGTPTIGEAPLLVTFDDLSIGVIDSWFWEFGDGDTSQVQSPEHEYISPGNYSVSLLVSGPGGSDVEVKVDYILIPVGINDNTIENILVYPNPVSGYLNIVFPNAQIRNVLIESVGGKQVFSKTIKNKHEKLNLQMLKPASYTLTIIDDTGKSTTTIIVKK